MFLWNEEKRKSNLDKHKLDFADAEKVFDGLIFTFEDDRDYEEIRFKTIGMLNGYCIVIIHTEYEGNTHIISMRLATKFEENLYSQSI